MKAAEKGFSLVEVMATLAVMSLAIGMVASSVGASLNSASQTGDDPAKALRRVMSIIRSALANPAPAGGLARIAPLFGDERRLHFITADERDGGLVSNRFVSSAKGLIWNRSTARHERDLLQADFSNDPVTVVPDLANLRFAYRANDDGGWRSAWAVGPKAPVLVRVEISAKGGRVLSGVVRIGAER